MLRLRTVHEGHEPEMRAQIEQTLAEGGFVSDIGRMLRYRHGFLGAPLSDLLQAVMKGPSDWSLGERELMAAFVSAQNQCPF